MGTIGHVYISTVWVTNRAHPPQPPKAPLSRGWVTKEPLFAPIACGRKRVATPPKPEEPEAQ